MTANEKKLTRYQQLQHDCLLRPTDAGTLAAFSGYQDQKKLQPSSSSFYPVFMLKEAFRLAGAPVPEKLASSDQYYELFATADVSELLETARRRLDIKPN